MITKCPACHVECEVLELKDNEGIVKIIQLQCPKCNAYTAYPANYKA